MLRRMTNKSLMDSFLLCATFLFHLCLKVSSNAEGDALNALKNNLNDPNNILQNWDPTQANPCSWFRVTCNSDNRVVRIDLGDEDLSGQLVPQLGQLPNLQYLELHSNNISGKIPDELGNLTNLVSLDLYLNRLTGAIPDTLGNLKKLHFLRFNNNSLSGNIPMSLTNVASLQVLDLSNNQLKGDIPVNGSFFSIPAISFQNNPGLKQHKFSVAPPVSPPSPPARTGKKAAAAIAGSALAFTAPAIVFALAYWRRRKPEDYFFDVPAEPEVNFWELYRSQIQRFSIYELQAATDNFNNRNIVGRGGFGKVYKGLLADGTVVAVKRMTKKHTQFKELDFQTELEMIRLAVHRNSLRLLGFCITPSERLLVYPFMVNGTLASCLRERPESQPPLDWPIRKRIALGAARGLAYLHEHCDLKIIHRDVKASNILLDEEFEAVLGDFGLVKHMNYQDTHVTTAVRGTFGHIAPEYLSTGKASDKSDVFGYGVMLLELISGQRTFDLAQLASDHNAMLLNWVKELVRDKRLEIVMDADILGRYKDNQEEFEQYIKVALLCTKENPLDRPKMSEVIRMLEDDDDLAEKWEQWQKQEMLQQLLINTPHHVEATANPNWIQESYISEEEL